MFSTSVRFVSVEFALPLFVGVAAAFEVAFGSDASRLILTSTSVEHSLKYRYAFPNICSTSNRVDAQHHIFCLASFIAC